MSLNKDTYKNPKIDIINKLLSYAQSNWDLGDTILDMCCGSGEVSMSLGTGYKIIGLDPYTYNLYIKNTNNKCLEYTFDDIVLGKLNTYTFDTVICSFALHLCEESKLSQLLWQLSLVCRQLIIITPHKRPDCKGTAFELSDSYKIDKCTIKLYTSKNYNLYN